MTQISQVTLARVEARVPVIKPCGAHALELDSPWGRNDKHAFPTVHLRQRLSLPTLLCVESC
eukprot:740376-Pyramimonas_sp.AAC.1